MQHSTKLVNWSVKTVLSAFRSALLLVSLTAILHHASAATYNFNFTGGFANSAVIPDGNTNGWSDTRTLSGIENPLITDVNVRLNLGGGFGTTDVSTNDLTGGFNGDFYAYLTHDSGFSVLLNRVGRTSSNASGYDDKGFDVVFDDAAAIGDIHAYQNIPGYASLITGGGAWAPDGRNVNPLLALDTDSRTSLLNQFNGLNPNGNWTLFIADVSTGEQTVIYEWGLNITAVPEPTSLSLGVLGGLIWLCVKRKLRVA